MKKFLMTLLVLAIAIVPLFSMVVMAYDYTNDKYFSTELPAAGANLRLTTSSKANSSIAYSKVKFSTKSEVNQGYVWVETTSGTMMSEKVYILPDGNTRQMNYKDGTTFQNGATVCFYGEQYNVAKKAVIGRAYPY